MLNQTQNKTSKAYWDQSWSSISIPSLIDPTLTGLRNYPRRCWHQYFKEVFSSMETNKLKLLEIGCARSIWLPYFRQEFGFDIYGIDYSEIGCQQEKELLQQANIDGTIVCTDFFFPPEEMKEVFDIVISFGVAEHFENTTDCIKAFSQFLKPGGIIITVIPNMVGSIGWFQKTLNHPVFDIHVLLDKDNLAEVHQKAGLKVSNCDYFMNTNFAVCNLNGIKVNSLEFFIKKTFLIFLISLSVLIWLLEELIPFFKFKSNIYTSPYINCIAIKS